MNIIMKNAKNNIVVCTISQFNLCKQFVFSNIILSKLFSILDPISTNNTGLFVAYFHEV